MKVLVVLTHPRRDSLTGQIADAVAIDLDFGCDMAAAGI